jgi:hypothetical protein
MIAKNARTNLIKLRLLRPCVLEYSQIVSNPTHLRYDQKHYQYDDMSHHMLCPAMALCDAARAILSAGDYGAIAFLLRGSLVFREAHNEAERSMLVRAFGKASR